MTVNRGHWVRQLHVDATQRVEPVCSASFLDAARGEVGSAALDWAVRLGYDVAVRAVENFPEFGSGRPQIDILRLGAESAAVIAMVGIYTGDRDATEIAADAVRAIQDWVHRGISLPVIWAAMRMGHSALAENYMRACVEVVGMADQPDQLRFTSEVLFTFIDRFSAAVGREYGIEHERWVMSTVAAREETVHKILAGQLRDTAAAEKALRYKLSHRHHVGLTCWTESLDAAANSPLHKAAESLLHALGAEHTLLLPQGSQGIYAWGNSPVPLDVPTAQAERTLRPGLRVSVGSCHPGQDGFVQTHREAQSARSVAESMPGIDSQVVDFHSVHLLTLLAQDCQKAEYFVAAELDGLAGNDPQLAELRNTAAAYLRLKRSPLAVANELFVVRNTVSYRLKKVEELLGHPLDERTLETWVALHLKESLAKRR